MWFGRSARKHPSNCRPYLALLAQRNGGEGPLGTDPGWYQLWPAEHVLEWNASYQLAVYVPGFFGFGSNGGGELLAFDTRGGQPFPIVAIPFIPMDASEGVLVAKSFAEFHQIMDVDSDEK